MRRAKALPARSALSAQALSAAHPLVRIAQKSARYIREYRQQVSAPKPSPKPQRRADGTPVTNRVRSFASNGGRAKRRLDQSDVVSGCTCL